MSNAGNLALQGYNQQGQLGLAGTQQQLAGAAQQGALAGQELQGQEGILQLQQQAGGVQQQQNQNIINQAMSDYNTAQQYPWQMYSNLSNILRGMPMSNTTTQNYTASPNPASQAAGLGVAGLALASKAA